MCHVFFYFFFWVVWFYFVDGLYGVSLFISTYLLGLFLLDECIRIVHEMKKILCVILNGTNRRRTLGTGAMIHFFIFHSDVIILNLNNNVQ